VNAVLDAGRGRTTLEYHGLLEDAEIDALHGSFRSLVVRTADGDKSALWSFLHETERLGTGHSEITDAVDVARLFALALENQPDRETPTLAFTVKPEFREQRADQRREICEIIAELSRGCNVHIAGETDSQQWLIDTHRSDLPVSESCSATPTRGPMSELVDAALGKLNPDGREAVILRRLSDEPAGTLSYHSLYSAFQVDESRVRQCINRLESLGLVNTHGAQNKRKVELLEAGDEFLSQTTRQSTLEDTPPNSYSQTTCTTPNETEEGRDGRMYQTTGERWPNKTAATAIGLDNDVCLVQEPAELDETEKERKNKRVYYDESRDVATVSVRAGEGLPYLVSLATTLTERWFLDETLPNERIEGLEEPPLILREGRNIGSLSDRALDNPGELRKALSQDGDDLESLTTKLHNASGDNKKALAADIMRQSHGLIGSVVHLLDAAGIDVVREVRVPQGRGLQKLENLSESIARSILIQSKYGVQNTAPYRHFIETDAGEPLLSPPVDATDGSLIGSFVIRGKDVHRLKQPLETALSAPGEFLDNPPAFSVPVTVREADRPEFAVTITRMLKSKNLKPTREAVSILHALTGSPYDVARAVNQLSREETVREVRPGELRYALSTLEAERILPGLPRTVGKVVYELLQAIEPVSQAELAERADVSTQSIRNNRDALEALGIVSTERGAWRLNLSFRTTEERRSPVTPALVDSTFTEAVDALLTAVLPPSRYGDPEDPVGGVLFWPPDPWELVDHPDLEPWVKLAAALSGTENPVNETSISVGPEINQTAITDAGAIA